uniref:Synaptobrevin, longin-like domain protein n=1 Tax=Tanacetum cinerariifolium TaxID=118510 RepID=A0A699H1Y5_TANCI|nr:synaptobrevin, longin-like domain protein [Tanacetum cinerariifolium]
MDNLGYVIEGKLTFFKKKFSPQWRFLVYTLLHCLSTNSGSWDQFGSPLVVALICLSDGRRFNWSSYIFKGMISNIGNARKFLMYPRFLQTILGIETRVTRQYKVLVFSSKLFANMRLNFAGHPMPLLHAMLLQAQAGEGAEVAAQAVSQPMHAPDQPPAHLSTPSMQQTFDPIASVLEHAQSFDPNTASFSRSHETNAGPFTSVEDAPMGGTFHTSPLRSTQDPPTGQPSGGAEDPITLTSFSSVVSTLVQKVHSLETELKDHKKLFKDVVGKLVKKVKALVVKLKTKKRQLVVSDSDQEDGGKQDMDLDALRALANAAVTVDSNIPSGGTSQIPTASPSVSTVGPPGTSDIPPGTSDVPPGTSNVPPGTSAIPTGASTVPAGSLSVPIDVPSSVAPAGMEEDRLGEKAAKRLDDEEKANLDGQRAELQHRRQEEVLDSTVYYTEADWLNIMAQVEANASRSKSLLAPIPSVPEVTHSPAVSSPPSSRIRRKSLGWKRITKPKSTLLKLDLDAEAQTLINVVVIEDSNDEASPVWSAVVRWEVLPTPLGKINALYRIDGSTKLFTTFRQILHMVDRHDLMKLYGLVGKGFLCLATSKSMGDKKLEAISSFQCSCFETVSGEVLYMFTDVSYPLSVKLLERMLMHKLEIDTDVVGNDMTAAE